MAADGPEGAGEAPFEGGNPAADGRAGGAPQGGIQTGEGAPPHDDISRRDKGQDEGEGAAPGVARVAAEAAAEVTQDDGKGEDAQTTTQTQDAETPGAGLRPMPSPPPPSASKEPALPAAAVPIANAPIASPPQQANGANQRQQAMPPPPSPAVPPQPLPTSPSAFPPTTTLAHKAAPLFACGLRCAANGEDATHDAELEESAVAKVSQWRVRDRMKTTTVSLVLCLNIGVDPPDVVRTSPCARLECWVDPRTLSAQKALEAIGKNLQAAYERWQPRARYKASLDPTVDDVRKLCAGQRRCARGERMLFHYNGHGVPKPTPNGELWVFNKSYTQYIPLSLYDLQHWVGVPSMYVLDCHAAGLALNAYLQFAEQRQRERESENAVRAGRGAGAAGGAGGVAPSPRYDYTRDAILLAACGPNETLPQTQDLPADVFTSCLVTPIRTALLWLCNTSPLLRDDVCRATGLSCIAIVDKVPGKANDRRTPLGELNWIFTAVTDTIAWNALPRPLFQRLFRQDLLVASLFRNFLLACRLMRAHGCTPQSIPVLPPTHEHPIWRAWDAAAEACLAQLPRLLAAEGVGVSGGADGTPQTSSPVPAALASAAATSPPASPAGNSGMLHGTGTPIPSGSRTFIPGLFFAEQLTAFEVWFEGGGRCSQPPEQLPVVLQVLLSQAHRLRALVLLGKFLDLGSWAVDAALSVGIFPYVLKLLQTTASDLRHILVFIWTKLLAVDVSCQADLVKDGGHAYFLRFLSSADTGDPASPTLPASAISREDHRAMAAFCLAQCCYKHPRGRAACLESHALGIVVSLLETVMGDERSSLLTRWLCLLLGNLWDCNTQGRAAALERGVHHLLGSLLDNARVPAVRASAAYALGLLLTTQLEELDAVAPSPSGTAPTASPLLMRSSAGAGGTSSSLAGSGGAAPTLGPQLSNNDSFSTLGANASLGSNSTGSGAIPQRGSSNAMMNEETMRGGASVRSAGTAGTPSTPESGILGSSGTNLGTFVAMASAERAVVSMLISAVHDGSALVRREVACALARAAMGQGALIHSNSVTPATGVTPTSVEDSPPAMPNATPAGVPSNTASDASTIGALPVSNEGTSSATTLPISERPNTSDVATLEEVATSSALMNRTHAVRVAGTSATSTGSFDGALAHAQLPAALHDRLLALSRDAHPAVAIAAVEALTAAGVNPASERPQAYGGGGFWFDSSNVSRGDAAGIPSSSVAGSLVSRVHKGGVARSSPREAPSGMMADTRKHGGSWSPMGIFRRMATSGGSHREESRYATERKRAGSMDLAADAAASAAAASAARGVNHRETHDGASRGDAHAQPLPGMGTRWGMPSPSVYARERLHFSRPNLPSAFAEEEATERAAYAMAAASMAEQEAAGALAAYASYANTTNNPLTVVVGGANPTPGGDACITLAFAPSPTRSSTAQVTASRSHVAWAPTTAGMAPAPPPPPPPLRLVAVDRMSASRVVMAENGMMLASLPSPPPPPARFAGNAPARAGSAAGGEPSVSGSAGGVSSPHLGVGSKTHVNFAGAVNPGGIGASTSGSPPPVYSFVVQDDPSAEHALLGIASNDGSVRFYSGWNASVPNRAGASASSSAGTSAGSFSCPPAWMEESMRLVDDLFRESTGTSSTRAGARSSSRPELVAAFRAVPYDADALEMPSPQVMGTSPASSVSTGATTRSDRADCVFEWQAGSELLYAGGVGRQVYVWDARAERLAATVTLSEPEHATALCAARALLIAGSSGGSLALFDLRDHSPTTLALHRTYSTRLVGARIVHPGGAGPAEPTNPGFLLATAAADGMMHLSDLRKPGEPIRKVEAHGGWLSRLASHPIAPLLATVGGCGSALTEGAKGASANDVGVVRLWSGDGSLLSTVHAPAAATGHAGAGGGVPLGPTCVAFHPRQLVLGIGLSNGSVTALGCPGIATA